jgi:nucleoside-diphosphate-sugar epimerase
MPCSFRCTSICTIVAAIFIYLVQLKWNTFITTSPSLNHNQEFSDFLKETRETSTKALNPAVSTHNFLVIGGNGFTGGYLVEDLIQRGAKHVKILSRKGKPSKSKLSTIITNAYDNKRVSWIKGSMTNVESVTLAVKDTDVVFLVAAHYGSPTFSRYGDWSAKKTTQVNVEGTNIVVKACQQSATTQLLIYTSSSDVVFDRSGKNSVNRTEANTYYPLSNSSEATCHYIRSKGLGEKRLLEANGDLLTTVALRPSGIYGPKEDFFMPKVVAPGFLTRNIGLGTFFYFDTTHVSDMIFVYNLILAELNVVERYYSGHKKDIGGEAFFITDGDAVNLAAWEAWVPVFHALDIPLKRWLWIPPSALRFTATWSEWVLYKLRDIGLCNIAPMLTEHEGWRATTTMHHDITKAKEKLQYMPVVSTEEGMVWLGKEMKERYRDL